MDAVGGRTVEGVVALVVRDLRPGVREDALAAVNCLECGPLLALEGRHTVDLFGVEDRVHPVNEAALILFGGFVATVSVRFPVLLFRLRLHLPEFDVRSLFALSNLPAILGGLLVRHPAGIFVSAGQTGRHEVDRIAASVRFVGGWVERHAGGLPRLLPWRNAIFEHLDDGISDLLTVVAFRRRSGSPVVRAGSLKVTLLRETFI